MAGSGSILGFVSQLQNMELQMASILMETAMKLASMTDANVFMLVEHSGGRYFSGKRHLCDSYLNRGLCPIGNDVEMEVNPDISALQERPHTFFPPPHSSPSNSRQSRSTTPHQIDSPLKPSSRKRSSGSQHISLVPQTQTSPSKKSRMSDGVGTSVSAPSTNDLKVEVTSEGFQFVDDGESADATYESAVAKRRQASENDDAVIICEDEEAVLFASPDQPPPSIFLGEEADLSLISDSDKQWIFAEILQHPKLEAVKQICDETVSDKNSVSSKLLNSLLYDFSKIAAAKCPFRNIEDPKCKQFYSLCFEEIWNQLPNLQALHDRGVTSQIGKRLYPLKVACRERFRNNFRTNLKSNRLPSTL